MRRVSKSFGATLALIIVVLTLFGTLTLSQSRAEAQESQVPAHMLDIKLTAPAVNVSQAPAIQMPVVLEVAQPTTRPMGDDQSNCQKLIGGVRFLNVACKPIDAVVGGVNDVIDFVKNPFDAVAQWVGKQIGKAIGWGGEGVVNLVVGVHEQCEAEFTDTAAGNKECAQRIHKDYFPPAKDTDKGTEFYVPRSAVSSEAFDRDYGKYLLIALMLLVPMVIAGAVQAVISGKPVVMLRSVFLHLPLGIMGMVITPFIVRSMMAIVDGFSSYILGDIGTDMAGFFDNANVVEAAAASAIFSLIPLLFVALIFLFACMLIWFILSMREASVALLTMFMPIAFAAAVWPALGKWALRGIKLVTAAIISKIFIVGAISLGIGVFSGASGQDPANPTSANGNTFSFSHLIFGSTIFFIAAFSPHLVMKFFDEIGEALNAAGGTGAVSRGLSVSGNVNGTRALLAGSGGGVGGGGLGGGGDLGAKALGGTEGGKALAGGAGVASAAKTAATVAKSAGGGAQEVGGAAANTYAAGGMNSHDAAVAGGGQVADQARAAGASPVEAGKAGGMGAYGGGADAATAGQVAFDETRKSGGSVEQAKTAQSTVATQVGADIKARAKREKKGEKLAQGNGITRFVKNTSPIHHMMNHKN